jgi:hypothetical protein
MVRDAIGHWLADDLDLGPTADQRAELVGALGRLGWHVVDGTLRVGEKLRPLAAPDSGPDAAAETVVRVCRRFPAVARELTHRHGDRHRS